LSFHIRFEDWQAKAIADIPAAGNALNAIVVYAQTEFA
jgi:hypothetical protein